MATRLPARGVRITDMPIYAGMDETTIIGVDVPEVSSVDAKQVTEAIDEPLDRKSVLAIVAPFMA